MYNAWNSYSTYSINFFFNENAEVSYNSPPVILSRINILSVKFFLMIILYLLAKIDENNLKKFKFC